MEQAWQHMLSMLTALGDAGGEGKAATMQVVVLKGGRSWRALVCFFQASCSWKEGLQ